MTEPIEPAVPSPSGEGTVSQPPRPAETAGPGAAPEAVATTLPPGYIALPPGYPPPPGYVAVPASGVGAVPPQSHVPAGPGPGYLRPPAYPGDLPASGYPPIPAVPPQGGYPHGYPPAPGFPRPGFPPPGFPRSGFPPAGYFPPPVVTVGGAPLADVWARFLSRLIDGLIVGAALLVVTVPALIWIFTRLVDATLNDSHEPDLWAIFRIELPVIGILLVAQVVAYYIYEVTLMHRSGQTVGKRVMKIKIVAVSGAPITLRQARLRWVVQNLSFVAPYFSYADSLWLLWDKPYQQCLHDKCAETVVVKVQQ